MLPDADDSSAPARVFPRRKRGEAIRKTDKPVLLTSDILSPHFDKPLKEAALALVRPRAPPPSLIRNTPP